MIDKQQYNNRPIGLVATSYTKCLNPYDYQLSTSLSHIHTHAFMLTSSLVNSIFIDLYQDNLQIVNSIRRQNISRNISVGVTVNQEEEIGLFTLYKEKMLSTLVILKGFRIVSMQDTVVFEAASNCAQRKLQSIKYFLFITILP